MLILVFLPWRSSPARLSFTTVECNLLTLTNLRSIQKIAKDYQVHVVPDLIVPPPNGMFAVPRPTSRATLIRNSSSSLYLLFIPFSVPGFQPHSLVLHFAKSLSLVPLFLFLRSPLPDPGPAWVGDGTMAGDTRDISPFLHHIAAAAGVVPQWSLKAPSK